LVGRSVGWVGLGRVVSGRVGSGRVGSVGQLVNRYCTCKFTFVPRYVDRYRHVSSHIRNHRARLRKVIFTCMKVFDNKAVKSSVWTHER
jgi:hypothetical protein